MASPCDHRGLNSSNNNTPFWNNNIPASEWAAECPEYLLEVDDIDRAHLGTKDEDYKPLTWEAVQQIISTNRLEAFTRKPSELRRYRKFIGEIKEQYGSVMNFILKQRIKWNDLTPKGPPFKYSDDLRILYNDWPYGLDPKIVHLVVWTKFDLEADSATGDLTPRARRSIEDFVTKTFKTGNENSEHILWFKNWAALKSVHAVEHFHVLLYDPDAQFIQTVTGGDKILSVQLAQT